MREFKQILRGVDRSYDDFVSMVVTFIKMPGNAGKRVMITDYIEKHPYADSSDVLQYMAKELGLVNMSGAYTKAAVGR